MSKSNPSSFYDKVYDIVRKVPKGRVTSYGAVAKFVGTGLSSRMVGYAMNKSGGQFPSVPAHRVVNRLGMLTGKHHFSYPEQMQELLESDGVIVKNDQVSDFKKLFWDPTHELDSFDLY